MTDLDLHPYTLKHGSPGWWVDGACGYLVAGYYDTEEEAVFAARARIREVKRRGERPSWLF